MKKEYNQILKITLMVLLPLIVFYLGLIYFSVPELQSCEDMDFILGFKYDSCYNLGSQSLLLYISKYSQNEINAAVRVQLPGLDQPLDKLPVFGDTENYKFNVDSPSEIKIVQLLRKGDKVCENQKRIAIENCQEEQVRQDVIFNTVKEIKLLNETTPNQTSGEVFSGKVDRERVFVPLCQSEWICSDWGLCEGGMQKRICKDKLGCLVSTKRPEIQRTCSLCNEDWQCTWSECIDGFSVPDCVDLNSCGTKFNLPKKARCSLGCVPDVTCDDWSGCSINYSMHGAKSVEEIEGFRSRICRDINYCSPDSFQTEECSLQEEIFSMEEVICGTKYIEIYSADTKKLIGRIKNDVKENSPDIGILFDSSDIICDSCSNGVKDNGEFGVDCGGSCSPCKKQAYSSDFISGFVERVRNLIKRI